jgi:hypothetical protein
MAALNLSFRQTPEGRMPHSVDRMLHSVDRMLHSVDRMLHSVDRMLHSVDRMTHSVVRAPLGFTVTHAFAGGHALLLVPKDALDVSRAGTGAGCCLAAEWQH